MNSEPTDPVFGTLGPDGHGHWSTTLVHRDRELRADLNIDGELDIDRVKQLTSKLADLPALEQAARDAMVADFARPRNSAVALYRRHHQDQLAAIESATNIKVSGEDTTFLSICDLRSVALYPDYRSHCLIMDFKLREATTDYLLVVSFNSKGEVAGIDMES
jgi:hypothetical protein